MEREGTMTLNAGTLIGTAIAGAIAAMVVALLIGGNIIIAGVLGAIVGPIGVGVTSLFQKR